MSEVDVSYQPLAMTARLSQAVLHTERNITDQSFDKLGKQLPEEGNTMPIPVSERKAWAVVFAEQFTSTAPPYFGTNIFDVLTVNWEPVLKNVRQQHEGLKQYGGGSHLFAVRDDGQRKRVLWINHFPNGITMDKDTLLQFGESPVWVEFCTLVESYQWFCTTEQQL